MMLAFAALRTLVGLSFVAAGIVVLAGGDRSVADFVAWHVPLPAAAVWAVGATGIVCGALFALGALTRPVALLLATIAVGVYATAGRSAGGAYAAVPPFLFAICVFFAWRSNRRGGVTPLRPPGVQ